ncbi:hypothetical protein FC83_GL000391 [Agrilactobacillus composti DSM 18527 = JCM 14202]|uniref:Uncharacterized protein n=1 Tax=Agrilactobacillus composti DSM 18527 = JCM 14202 TaxID=1423734 RepID=A0A0R1XZX3_9LACO|nr:hypothetical protein FC83_GL000391 [Agrilactobacillus composti DSM 18527 = JCM 14202]
MQKLDFLEAGITFIHVANSQLLWDLQRFWQVENVDNFVFSSDGKILHPLKDSLFIGDLGSNIDLNDIFKRQIYKILLAHLDEQSLQQLYRLDSQIKAAVTDVIFTGNLPIQLNQDWAVDRLIKYLEPSVDTVNVTTPYDIINSVLEVMGQLNDKRLPIFSNPMNYLDLAQLRTIAAEVMTQQRSIVFFEKARDEYLTYKLMGGVKMIYIDADFVAFDENRPMI